MYWLVKVSEVTFSKGMFFATPALLMMMSIWNLPDLLEDPESAFLLSSQRSSLQICLERENMFMAPETHLAIEVGC